MSKCELSQQEVSNPEEASSSVPAATTVPAHRPRLLLKLVLLFAGTIVGLGLAEIGARLFVAVTHRVPLIESNARTGWALQPNLRDEIRGGDGGQYLINTDAEGLRLTRRRDEPVPVGSPTVLIVGDSYIQGNGVDDSQTFTWLLAHETKWNIVNLGVLGYGTDQELVCLETYLKTHPNLAVRDVVLFVTENDFTDVQTDYSYLGRNKPYFRSNNGRLDRGEFRLSLSDRFMDVSYLYWLVNSRRAAHFGKAPNEPHAGMDVVVACVAAMRESANERGARFHVLAHHLRQVAPMLDSAWAEFRQRTGATDITERLRSPGSPDPICYDRMHWDAIGHQRVAAYVKERLAHD